MRQLLTSLLYAVPHRLESSGPKNAAPTLHSQVRAEGEEVTFSGFAAQALPPWQAEDVQRTCPPSRSWRRELNRTSAAPRER